MEMQVASSLGQGHYSGALYTFCTLYRTDALLKYLVRNRRATRIKHSKLKASKRRATFIVLIGQKLILMDFLHTT